MNNTERVVVVELPDEFVDFCLENGIEPSEMLAAFVTKTCLARKKSIFCRSFFSNPEQAEQFLRPVRAQRAS